MRRKNWKVKKCTSIDEAPEAIKKQIPEFTIAYKPDSRQQIAETWPESIDDSRAEKDWGWKATTDLDEMVKTMLQGLHYTI